MVNGVRIDPELRDYIPKPSARERELLEEKLVSEGCTEKFVAWDNDPDNTSGMTLVDGYTRHEICERKGIGYTFRRMSFASKDHAKLWMLHNQAGRRNLTDDQRAVIALRDTELTAKLSKQERSASAASASRDARSGVPQMSLGAKTAPKLAKPKERAREAAAKRQQVPEKKVRAVAAIKKSNPELVEKIASGEVTIREANKQVKAEKPVPPPDVAKDENGTPIPDVKSIREAFDGKAGAGEILNHLTQLTGMLNRHRERPAGVTLRAYEPRINAAKEEIRTLVRDTQPWVICKDCGGREGGCDRCRKLGWHDKETAARR